MSSAIFVKQLTDEQIMLFFEAIPFKKMEKSVMDDERIAVVLLPKKGSPLLYEIDDYEVVDHNIDKSKQISSEEWQIYLRGIFGEEYLN